MSDLDIVFMNQQLLDKKSKEPKITILKPDGRRIHCNELVIYSAVLKVGTLDVGTHVLKAWLEVGNWTVKS